jgi:hypothetical protein
MNQLVVDFALTYEILNNFNDPYCHNDIDILLHGFGSRIRPIVANFSRFIVIFYGEPLANLDSVDYLELLNRGDGPCLFWATQTTSTREFRLHLLSHVWRHLRSEAAGRQFDDMILADFAIFATSDFERFDVDTFLLKYFNEVDATIAHCGALDREDKFVECLYRVLHDFKYAFTGWGLDMVETVRILKSFNFPSTLISIPLTDSEVESICRETGLPAEEVRALEDSQFRAEVIVAGDDPILIAGHHGHFSRLLAFETLGTFEAAAQRAGISVVEVNLTDGEIVVKSSQ